MKVGSFEIKCMNCGSKEVVIVDVHKDSEFDESFKRIKCANCHAGVEV